MLRTFINAPVFRSFPQLSRTFTTSFRAMGVTTEIIKEGDKQNYPKPGDTISMHYTGKLTNGTVFDSSVKRGKPFVCRIGVGELIRGWDEAVPKMSLGEKSILTITSDYGYGARGCPGLIPPDSTLVFEVELLKIN
ncbi:FK506 binding protein proline rotamase rapamycin-binding protein [Entomophthora muscae]|uniref:FK506 binding protein proline rotamase rapamycin-binding protein n=1 Tax=Entomophthora muscae TaxID=34485 RepID=A0ACC2UJ98_9FUNG|nr:FK506 binding protein proline rotamase rapamycin-binding protein [Entomophthora muscae]